MGKKLELIMAIVLIGAILLVYNQEAILTKGNTAKEKTYTIVIDAGHGGVDPGKVGVNQANEKDINLEIAKYVKKILEKKDINVVMVREEDKGLYEENSSRKKMEDMENRCRLIEETQPLCTVSVHQNSFHQEGVKGAQVFFYEKSTEGKRLAECLQEELRKQLDTGNKRLPKANNNYYLLCHTSTPIVIVECGFLSNWEEAELLVTKKYQKKVAEAICSGIEQYIGVYEKNQEESTY